MLIFSSPPARWVRSVSRLCWASVAAGFGSTALFLQPLLLTVKHGYDPQLWTAYLLAWLTSGLFGVVAITTGFLAQYRLRPGERYSMVLAVLGGSLGLAALSLSVVGLIGLFART